jgi:hypothetical protein
MKMDLKETGCEGVDWIHMSQGRVQLRAFVNTVKKFRVPQKAVEFLGHVSDLAS